MIVLHIFCSNIFLLNFLIAILSFVYEEMFIDGKFEYKKCKYEFIEKYSVALMDPWGYYEIVIHPPPINFFTLFILPFLIKGSIMKQASKVFAKFIFWFENSFYIFFFFLYEIVLWPAILFKVLYNIISLGDWLVKFPLCLLWFVTAPFYLLFVTFKDIFYMIKIMCDY